MALQRVPFGIAELDRLISGGVIKNSINLVAGSAGAGKSIFALQFLVNGIKKYGEPGVYITFEEKKKKTGRKGNKKGRADDEQSLRVEEAQQEKGHRDIRPGASEQKTDNRRTGGPLLVKLDRDRQNPVTAGAHDHPERGGQKDRSFFRPREGLRDDLGRDVAVNHPGEEKSEEECPPDQLQIHRKRFLKRFQERENKPREVEEEGGRGDPEKFVGIPPACRCVARRLAHFAYFSLLT